MDRSKRGVVFIALLLVSVFLPAKLLATKQLHYANISKGTAGVGVSSLVVNNSTTVTHEYVVRTYARPGQSITAVWLSTTTNSWTIPLCTNGGPVDDDCSYLPDGNLDIEGSITPSMLISAGVTGKQFNDALKEGRLTVRLSDTSAGTYIRIM